MNMELLDSFIGLTYNHDDRFLVIWQASTRCALKVCTAKRSRLSHAQDLIFDDDFNLNEQFSSSFIRDMLRVSV
jgi:hypothetical protein